MTPIIGAIYILGRFVFSSAYIKDPSGRTLGFVMSMLPILVLLIGGVVGAVMSLMT